MIIFKCDICGMQTNKLDSVILYKKKIDFCEDCRETAENFRKNFEKELIYMNKEHDLDLRQMENNFIKSKIEVKKNDIYC